MGKLTPEALLIAASGIVIVFLVLAALCFLIPVVSRLTWAFTEEPVTQQAEPQKSADPVRQAEPQPVAPAPVVSAPVTPAPIAAAPAAYGGNIILIDVDEKTAACVMAIVSHETGIPISELIFKKIKAL